MRCKCGAMITLQRKAPDYSLGTRWVKGWDCTGCGRPVQMEGVIDSLKSPTKTVSMRGVKK